MNSQDLLRVLQVADWRAIQGLASKLNVPIQFKGRGGTYRYYKRETLTERIVKRCDSEHLIQHAINILSGKEEANTSATSATTTVNTASVKETATENNSANIKVAPTITADDVASIVKDIIADHIRPKVIEIKTETETRTIEGLVHEAFPALLKAVSAGVNVWLAGPAGSGKTWGARQVADTLGLPFYFNGAIDTEYKLTGFVNATGGIVSAPFRQAWTNGGVYLFDELDASMPSAVLALNAALAGDYCDFPGSNEPVKKHINFRCIAAANTRGGGATHEYVGRARQDAAFLDRFVFLAWNYDPQLESAMNPPEIVSRVKALRNAALNASLEIVISPRAASNVRALIAAGMDKEQAWDLAIFNKLSPEDAASLRRAVS